MMRTTLALAAFATLLGCGGGDAEDLIGGREPDASNGGGRDAAPDDASISAPDAGDPFGPGEVICSGDHCTLPDEECCDPDGDGGGDPYQCVATGTCPALWYRCDQREDCGADYCCWHIDELGIRCTPASECEFAFCQQSDDCPPSAAACCDGICKPSC
jgi:hypothetical protein